MMRMPVVSFDSYENLCCPDCRSKFRWQMPDNIKPFKINDNLVQVYNFKAKEYVLLDKKIGHLLGHQSKPYKNIPIINTKKRKASREWIKDFEINHFCRSFD